MTDVGVNVTASPISVSLTNVAAGDLIVCEVSLEQGVTLTSVSDPSNGTYSPAIAFHTNSTMTQQLGIYFVANAAAGSYPVSVAWTGGAQSYQAMACQSWTGAAISSPQDTTIAQQQDNSSTSNPTSGSSLTPASAGELVIGNLMTSTQTPTAGANYALTDSAPVTNLWPEYWVQTAAAATNSPYTTSSDNWTDQTVAFKPAYATSSAITRNAHGVTDVGVNVTASPISVSLTNVAAGDLIVCEVSLEQGATLTSVSDPSNGTYSPAIAFHTNSTMTQQLGIYFVANAAAGSYPVSVAWTGGAQSYQAMACQSWTGAAISSPQDTTIAQQQDDSSTSNPTSGSSLSPASAGELVIGNLMTSTQTPMAGVNYALTDSAPVTNLWPEYWVQTAAAATNSPYTSSSDNWTDQTVAFKPVSAGAAAPATTPATTPALSINTTTIAFGDVVLNNPATQSVTLTSSGTASVTVSAATVTGTGFTVSGASFPLTLSPNQTATLSIEFDPTAAGAASGSLTLSSNSSTGSSSVIALTGTGETASASSQVSLTWDAPTTSTDPVAGYYVYRSPSGSSSYQQLNASAITQTSYDDTTAQAGQTYDYIVESTDASGVTSAPSNMASVSTQ